MSPILNFEFNFFAFFKLIFAYCVFCSFTWILRRTAHFSFTILNPKFSHHFNSCRTWTHGKHSFSHMYTLHLLCISTSTPPPSSNQDSSSWKISAKSSNYQVTKMSICCMLKVKNVNFFLDETKSFFMAKLNENSVT